MRKYIICIQFKNFHCYFFTVEIADKLCDICSCSQNGSEVDCSMRNLAQIPEQLPIQLKYLNIQGNQVTKLGTWTFLGCNQLQKLDISNNLLTVIDPGAFRQTPNLMELIIHNNSLVLNSSDVFSPLSSSLVTLSMQNNNYSDRIFQNLPLLQSLSIDGHSSHSFGAGFSELHRLNCLEIHFKSSRITNTTFLDLSTCPIEHLNIISTKLNAIDSLGFSHLHSMQILNLSNNQNLNFDSVSKSWFGLQFTNITTLLLTRIVSPNEQATIVSNNFYEYLNLTNITRMYLDKNNIIQVDVGMSTALPQLEYLDMSYNRLLNVADFLFEVYYLQKLRVADSSYQVRRFPKKRQITRDAKIVRTNWGNQVSTIATRELQYVKSSCKAGIFTKCEIFPIAKNSSVRPLPNTNWCVIAPKRLEVLNLTQSLSVVMTSFPPTLILSAYKLRHFEYRANGLTSVTGPIMINLPRSSGKMTVDFADNSISCLAKDVFSYSISRGLNIGKLLLSGNNLYEQLAQDENGETFLNYRNLTELNLANNRIKTLPVGVFNNVPKLKILNLSSNYLQLIEFEMKHFERLNILDLSFNLLTSLEPAVQRDLSRLMRNVSSRVDLLGNPLQCSCESLVFLHWLERKQLSFKNFEITSCLYRGKMFNFTDVNDIIDDLDFSCSKTVALVISGSLLGLTLIGIFISICLYRHRWDIRYCMLKMSHKGKKYQRLIDQTTTYKYDAFVAYDKDDRSWVRNELIPNMESSEDPNSGIEGHGMRFCIHERDFELGNWIEENIVSAIEQSRKVILVISANFLASNWCRFELEISRMQSLERGRNLVVPVLMETIDFANMPSSLQWLVRKHTYIEWKDHAIGAEQFWARLRDVLKETGDDHVYCECGRIVLA